ncbi:hypothetical protein B0E43_14345 [Algoriphagus sp. A40]|nr:hypothetical protein B0E43_14345 [Algoriphagus sp. A40]
MIHTFRLNERSITACWLKFPESGYIPDFSSNGKIQGQNKKSCQKTIMNYGYSSTDLKKTWQVLKTCQV